MSLLFSPLGSEESAWAAALLGSRTSAIAVVDGRARYRARSALPMPDLEPVTRTVDCVNMVGFGL